MTSTLRGDHLSSARPQLWRVTERGTFAALRQDGQRARRGPLTVTWLGPASDSAPVPPRVAFAIGTRIGGAVVRNRIRRRLRSALREIHRQGGLPEGSFLLSGDARLATLPWSELVTLTAELVTQASGRSS